MRARVVLSVLGALASGCGNTSGKVLERVDAATPPGSNLRMDAFLVRSARTCAIGPACASQGSSCFTLTDATGVVARFEGSQLQFVAPGDSRIAGAEQAMCFRLTLSDAQVSTIRDATEALRATVFNATGGEMNLDIRLHEVATLETAFSTYQNGPFLGPAALGAALQDSVSRDTDFAYVVTGYDDGDTGLTPSMNQCAGTGRITGGGTGSPFSWIGLSQRCIDETAFLSTFMIQLFDGVHDIYRLDDIYYSNGYASCGRGDADPSVWFPDPKDCTRDPDAPTCGQAFCPSYDEYYTHILKAHWPRGRVYIGNHCRDGQRDYDETSVDQGGTCAVIGN
jgi:hypothetical protein